MFASKAGLVSASRELAKQRHQKPSYDVVEVTRMNNVQNPWSWYADWNKLVLIDIFAYCFCCR